MTSRGVSGTPLDLSKIQIIDQHCHNVVYDEHPTLAFALGFTEGGFPCLPTAKHTLCYRRSVQDLAAVLACGLTEVEQKLYEMGIESRTRTMMNLSNIEYLLVDDGLVQPATKPTNWLRQFVPNVCRVLRIEYVAEQCLSELVNSASAKELTLSRWMDVFQSHILAEVLPHRQANKIAAQEKTSSPSCDAPVTVVAMKSVVAYRGPGLHIDPSISEDCPETQAAFKAFLSEFLDQRSRHTDDDDHSQTSVRVRIDNVWLNTVVLLRALLTNATLPGGPIPIQLHTGFGDTDLQLNQVDPCWLTPLLKDPRFTTIPFVLLHGSYPYCRQASYLCSVYPNVYLDLGLAFPLLSVDGMRSCLVQLLELAPTSKLLYSSDAHWFPELFYLSAKWARILVQEYLIKAMEQAEVSNVEEAMEIANQIFRTNAIKLYNLDSVRLF